MRIMIVGSGGREHALLKKIRENPRATEIYVLPGNGGMEAEATCVPIGAKDIAGIVGFAKEQDIDYAVVAPDDPLALGCVDALEAVGVPCFGPRADAAIIESSKIFSKELMKKYGIPTADYAVFEEYAQAEAYLQGCKLPIVVKADGLALGKGVIIAQTREEAVDAARAMMCDSRFGESGKRIVVEEYLEGPEVSILTFTDGKTIVPMISSMDHKRAADGDEGPNTGGMGTIAPNPFYTPELAQTCMETIFLPTIRAMAAEGRSFKGCLYFSLMLTDRGPRVIEYNCRFGDPEAQVVLPLLESDLLTIMQAVTEERLSPEMVRFSDRSACCVVMASAGYPLSYEKGYEINIPDALADSVYVAGARRENGRLLSDGGRVLGTTAIADTLSEAIESAYRKVAQIHFDNAYYRHDIGRCALEAEREH